MQVMNQLTAPCVTIDLFSELDETEIQNSILSGIATLLYAKYDAEFQPLDKNFLNLTHFSASSAAQSLDVLCKRDYIFMDDQGRYHILDPLIKSVFAGGFALRDTHRIFLQAT